MIFLSGMSKRSFAEVLATLAPADHVDEIALYDSGKEISRIPNITGKAGSVRVLSNSLGFEDGLLTQEDISVILERFAEHTEYEIAHPEEGRHPTVRLFLDAQTRKTNRLRGVLHFDIPAGLEQRVLELHEVKKAGKLGEKRQGALDTFEQVMDLLEKGYLRTAQYNGDGWKVNEWVKKGILLGFAVGANHKYGYGDIQFVDKDTLPLRIIDTRSEIRVVPPAAGLRKGSYAGKGTIFMPPAYVNVGAFVGRDTMAESLVGSCAQVGKKSHISAGAVIGGVLDPIEASPVILGDYVLMGEGSGVTQGTRLGDLVTLAPGVHISKGTPIADVINKKVYASGGTYSLEEDGIGTTNGSRIRFFTRTWKESEKDKSYGPEVPRGALIVPRASLLSSTGELVSVPTIVKYIDSPNERSYALEEALRSN